ncbi:MAG: alcohol dehydrogenase catalytic domain-containing protein, partial [Acidobacteria bacterium]|nr:alcohol dehydrogenase catalytic domain-containing protein [Acidobacteriota bacterium]
MRAAVYRGGGEVRVEEVPVPAIGPGELLVRVEACGICHTDLKKIAYNLLPPPRIYGHETAGVVAEVGRGAGQFRVGDRVALFHHIPCRNCFYCRYRLYAQCPTYKRVGITAGWEPAGGGFGQYVRVMDWVVRDGVVRVPDGISPDRACFVEPVNTCLKAVVKCEIRAGEVVAVLGQGPIGLLFTMLAAQWGAVVYATDPLAARRDLGARVGARRVFSSSGEEAAEALRAATEGRGADAVIVAAAAPGLVEQAIRLSRPGARILLFAQTAAGEKIELDGANICAQERTVLGCYSADVDLQEASARLVFSGELPVEDLISHRVPLDQIGSGIEMAMHPDSRTLKIIV